MKKITLPLSRVYGLLEPGPVVLVTTIRNGCPNVMTMSWHTMLEFEPPLVACVISNRNYTFDLLQDTKECVINIPTAELAKKVVACGNTSGAKTDKFKTFHLTAGIAQRVKAPLIEECHASMECRVVDTQMVNRYCLFIVQVVKAWIDPAVRNPRTMHHRGKGNFMIAGKTIRLRSRMK